MLQNRDSERTATVTRSVNNRAKITNNPRRLPVSGRTALGRRIADLADGYAAVLGGWSVLGDVLAANVRKAAELTALAEQKRADALRDGNVDPLAVVRLEGAANRAVRALNLDRELRRDEDDLASYLRRMSRPVAESAPEAVEAREALPAPTQRPTRTGRRAGRFRPDAGPSARRLPPAISGDEEDAG